MQILFSLQILSITIQNFINCNQALFQILSGRVNNQILCMMIESKNFPAFLIMHKTYFEDANAPGISAKKCHD